MVEADSVPDLFITMGNQLEFVRPRRPIFVLAAVTAFNHDSCSLNHVFERTLEGNQNHARVFHHKNNGASYIMKL